MERIEEVEPQLGAFLTVTSELALEQARKAVKMARAADIDTNGYFMVGLSCDTEKTMQETIDFILLERPPILVETIIIIL